MFERLDEAGRAVELRDILQLDADEVLWEVKQKKSIRLIQL